MVSREIDLAGYNRLILKSDQENSILDFPKAAKRERGEFVEIMPEESPVCDHQSNGAVERAVQNVEAQIKTMRLALESRYKCKIRADHCIMPWLVHHAAMMYNICQIGDDGKTPYERRKGKRFNRELPEIGECIHYLRPGSNKDDKLVTKWEDGIFAGIREESNELYVMTGEGVIKIRTYLRRSEEERWNREQFDKGRGGPWEPKCLKTHQKGQDFGRHSTKSNEKRHRIRS